MTRLINKGSGSGVYCDRCRSSYAVAIIDGAKLCRACIGCVTSGRDTEWVLKHTAPLELKTPIKIFPGNSGTNGSNQVA